jgi:hypothetical protein
LDDIESAVGGFPIRLKMTGFLFTTKALSRIKPV